MMFSEKSYPNLWKRGLIQERVRKRANHRCECCGMEFNRGTNIATRQKNRAGKPIVGTVHHIDMNPQNCSTKNLVYLCQSCHTRVHGLRFVPHAVLPEVWRDNVPQWIVERDIPYKLKARLF